MSLLTRERKPLALQARDALWDMFQREQYHPGDKLPSEQELAAQFSISRATVREALKLLEEQHAIVCRHGVGRFLLPGPGGVLYDEVTTLKSTTELVSGLGLSLDTRVLSAQEVTADRFMQERLVLEAGSRVVSLERVRSAGDEPCIYSTEIFPRSLARGKIRAEMFIGSLFSLMERDWGVRPAYSRAVISATLLDAETSQRIGVPDCTPWVLMEQVHYDGGDQPILFSRDHYRGDKFQFHVLRRRR